MNEFLDVVSDPTLVEQASTLSNPDLASTDFGLYSLFLRADWVVKIVMIGLVMASIQTWAIIIEKIMTLRRLSRKATDFEKLFLSGENLSSLYKRINGRADHPMARVFLAGMREWVRTSSDGKEKKITPELINRVDRTLNGAVAHEVGFLSNRLLFLATVGAIAPFIGLFGTVWGIMNSFQAIALTQDTNLAVVAPGIAEALFATGLGLLAAIPAVIAYNKFTSDINRYVARLDYFADEFSIFLDRQSG
ncbi:MAG: protein TolQ [Rhodobiaceae bacterium]|nr:protein TolQ [Rhodobiaceae bacterium]